MISILLIIVERSGCAPDELRKHPCFPQAGAIAMARLAGMVRL